MPTKNSSLTRYTSHLTMSSLPDRYGDLADPYTFFDNCEKLRNVRFLLISNGRSIQDLTPVTDSISPLSITSSFIQANRDRMIRLIILECNEPSKSLLDNEMDSWAYDDTPEDDYGTVAMMQLDFLWSLLFLDDDNAFLLKVQWLELYLLRLCGVYKAFPSAFSVAKEICYAFDCENHIGKLLLTGIFADLEYEGWESV